MEVQLTPAKKRSPGLAESVKQRGRARLTCKQNTSRLWDICADRRPIPISTTLGITSLPAAAASRLPTAWSIPSPIASFSSAAIPT
jgi:hypothetical protein